MHEIGACMKPQFFVDSCAICLYRFHTHSEFRCNRLGRKSYCNLTQNLRLSATEALHIGPAHCSRSAEQHVDNGIAEARIYIPSAAIDDSNRLIEFVISCRS